MKYALPAAMVLAVAALAGCERPATTSSTTVVQPTKEKETIVQRDVPVPAEPSSSTTIINPPAAPAPNVTIDATPSQTERTRSTTTERVDTPMGTATRTETETKTTR